MKMFRTIKCGALAAFLMLGIAAPLTFTSCENAHPEINFSMESDFSGIIKALNDANTALADKLANIEAAIKDGTLKSSQALEAIKAAVSSMEGTVAQKLAAIESAVKDQTTSFETKMGLIETALTEGFASVADGQDLMKQALESLEGTIEDKLAAVEEAIKNQTLSLETKFNLINTTVEEGLASVAEGQDLIVEALEAIDGTIQDKMDALEEAVNSQTTSLAAKLAAIETAVKEGFADEAKALGLVKDAVKAVDGTLKDKLDGIKKAVDNQTTELSTALAAIAAALPEDMGDILEDIADALDKINTSLGENGAIASQLDDLNDALGEDGIQGILDSILDAIAGSVDPETGEVVTPGLKDALEDIAAALAKIQDALNPKDEIDGHKFVEMGKLKFATENLEGAYAWGETTPKTSFTHSNFDPVIRDKYFTSHGGHGGYVLQPSDDAATKEWGSGWRIPSKEDWEYLLDEENFTMTFDDATQSLIFESKVEGTVGNKLILPAEGFQNDDTESTYNLPASTTQGCYYLTNVNAGGGSILVFGYPFYIHPASDVPEHEEPVTQMGYWIKYSIRPVAAE